MRPVQQRFQLKLQAALSAEAVNGLTINEAFSTLLTVLRPLALSSANAYVALEDFDRAWMDYLVELHNELEAAEQKKRNS